MGKYAIIVGFVVLFVLHQDFWNWNDRTMVFGFMPMGLFYHALFSLAAGVLWLAAVKFAWPSQLEAWADDVQSDENADAGKGGAQ